MMTILILILLAILAPALGRAVLLLIVGVLFYGLGSLII